MAWERKGIVWRNKENDVIQKLENRKNDRTKMFLRDIFHH